MTLLSIISLIFMIIGIFFAAVGVYGVLKMPDVFGRLQASTCVATMSTVMIALSAILYALPHGLGFGTVIKLALFALLILGTNPISNHALIKASYKMGIRPKKRMVIDDYAMDFGNGAEEPVAEYPEEKEVQEA